MNWVTPSTIIKKMYTVPEGIVLDKASAKRIADANTQDELDALVVEGLLRYRVTVESPSVKIGERLKLAFEIIFGKNK